MMKKWPLMWKKTHEKFLDKKIRDISHAHADMEERYWKSFQHNLMLGGTNEKLTKQNEKLIAENSELRKAKT
jgi:hypothetical protein